MTTAMNTPNVQVARQLIWRSFFFGEAFALKQKDKKRMGTIFIVVLVKIMSMNTTMNNGYTESSQKHTNIYAGGGGERIFI